MELRNNGALLVGTKRVGERVALRLAAEGVNLAIVHRRSRHTPARLPKTEQPLPASTALPHANLPDYINACEERKQPLKSLVSGPQLSKASNGQVSEVAMYSDQCFQWRY